MATAVYYVVLLVNDGRQSRAPNYVVCTTNPWATRDHCDDREPLADWRIDFTLGPFTSIVQATQCGNHILANTRGLAPKHGKARILSHQYGVLMREGSAAVALAADEPLHQIFCKRHR